MSIPYNYRRIGELDYHFTTDNGIEYRASFANAAGYFSEAFPCRAEVKSFGFQVITPTAERLPLDRRVGLTIGYVLLQYFAQNPEGILFFIYETSDGKERGRFRMFDRWFRAMASGRIKKLDASIRVGRIEIKGSLMLLVTHSAFEEIATAFEKYPSSLTEKPDA